MDFNSIPMFFICGALLYFAAATPLFSASDSPPKDIAQRLYPIDGLRGVLALSVFFHHGTFVRVNNLTGKWTTESHFYDVIGAVGVSVFFMITGYLFWSKIIRSRGRPGWARLYVGRVFRIAPLYLVTAFAVFVLVAIKSNFELREPISDLAVELGSWLGLGVFDANDINAVNGTGLIVSGVMWSLRYEWAFYASLIFSASLVKARVAMFPVLVAAFTACLVWSRILPASAFPPQLPIACALFLVGMLCAETKDKMDFTKFPPWAVSCIALLSVSYVFRFWTVYSVGPVILLGILFFLVVNGCTIFGFLVSRSAKRLGDMSYGIYLLHGLILTIMNSSPLLRNSFDSSPSSFWGLMVLDGVAVIAAATAAHVLVERPGIALGEKVAATLGLVSPVRQESPGS